MVPQTIVPIYSTLAHDHDMAELIEMFVAEVPEKLTRLEALLQAEDWNELKRLSHQLKGSAGGYGFGVVTAGAQKLEATLQNSDDVEIIGARVLELMSLLAAIR